MKLIIAKFKAYIKFKKMQTSINLNLNVNTKTIKKYCLLEFLKP